MNRVLAIDGGASHTRMGLYSPEGECLVETEGPGANPSESGLAQVLAVLARLAREVVSNGDAQGLTIAAGIAGAGVHSRAEFIANGLLARLGAKEAILTHDLAPVLLANLRDDPGLLVIAGTGSSILVQREGQQMQRVGGHGPLFGERGSAYAIARAALIAIASNADGIGPRTELTRHLLDTLGVDSLDGLVNWGSSARKSDVAALATEIDAVADDGDDAAAACVKGEAIKLANEVVSAARVHGLGNTPRIMLHGGVLNASKRFRESFLAEVEVALPGSSVAMCEVTGHRAAFHLAKYDPLPTWIGRWTSNDSSSTTSTEQRLLNTHTLDQMTPQEIAEVMGREDANAIRAVREAAPEVASAIAATATAFRAGGRLVYVGAGTSGRLGVLDASECPPTFGVSPSQVVGIIAGGRRALEHSVEGAEDDAGQGAADIKAITPPVGAPDFVMGISASGGAPYVHGALEAAKKLGAHTGLVTCNPNAKADVGEFIAVDTGAEVLPGSTRLKAGTATKAILNQITTGAMALSGRIYEGYMVGVGPVNVKLRKRAVRIVAELTGTDDSVADNALQAANGSISVAVAMHRLGLTAEAAAALLDETDGDLRRALGVASHDD